MNEFFDVVEVVVWLSWIGFDLIECYYFVNGWFVVGDEFVDEVI